jgi:SAC3 family protein LENG8/THP3
VHVYETHARVALESEDLNEYNQCQTQLKQLYLSGIPGNEKEFIAYRILYYIYLQGNKKYTLGSCDIAFLLQSLTVEQQYEPCIQHALQIREAVRQDDYHRFFQLYRVTPHLGNCILDIMLNAMRLRAMQRICKAYAPTIPVIYVMQELSFDTAEETEEFLRKLNCVIEKDETSDELMIQTKKTDLRTTAVFSEGNSLL